MVTTIQLSEDVKVELARMKTSPNETYEGVIVGMINLLRVKEREKLSSLKEGYIEWANELGKINKEWSKLDEGWD